MFHFELGSRSMSNSEPGSLTPELSFLRSDDAMVIYALVRPALLRPLASDAITQVDQFLLKPTPVPTAPKEPPVLGTLSDGY